MKRSTLTLLLTGLFGASAFATAAFAEGDDGTLAPAEEFAAELREFHIQLRADVKELLRRDSSLKERLMRRDSSMRRRLAHISASLKTRDRNDVARALKDETLAQMVVRALKSTSRRNRTSGSCCRC